MTLTIAKLDDHEITWFSTPGPGLTVTVIHPPAGLERLYVPVGLFSAGVDGLNPS